MSCGPLPKRVVKELWSLLFRGITKASTGFGTGPSDTKEGLCVGYSWGLRFGSKQSFDPWFWSIIKTALTKQLNRARHRFEVSKSVRKHSR
jgi:hypothetical protein